MIKVYEHLKSQGINCLMLINAKANLDEQTVKADIVFFPAKMGATMWVFNNKEKYLLDIPTDLQNQPRAARKLHWQTNFTQSKL